MPGGAAPPAASRGPRRCGARSPSTTTATTCSTRRRSPTPSTTRCSASCRRSRRSIPALVTPDSPTQRVGGAPGSRRSSRSRHRVPMLSIRTETRHHRGAAAKFDARVRRDWDFPRGAGGRVHGRAQVRRARDQPPLRGRPPRRGATRGDGEVGEDVTPNVRTIRAIPHAAARRASARRARGARRGLHDAARLRGAERAAAGARASKTFTNPRNTAAGRACASSTRR